MIFKNITLLILALFIGTFLSACDFFQERTPYERASNNNWRLFWVWLSKDARKAYNHSILYTNRIRSDCQPNCPKVDIWQYAYKHPQTGEVIRSGNPISSLKEFWKVPSEARVVAVTLYGNNPKYIKGLENFIASNRSLKKFNHISEDTPWAYDTFAFRIYVPKRNPKSNDKSKLIGELPEAFIEKLLNLGCEVVFVDNDLDAVGVDSFFWRFMVFAEEMEKGQKIRYLIRDSDWIITGAEALALGEWINSNYQFSRFQLLPTCMGPFSPIALVFNGTHTGSSPFYDLKTAIENYPYHIAYGDDEIFGRDRIWPIIAYQGSILTLHYAYDFFSFMGEPYQNSCERPTQNYCNQIKAGGNCHDELLPSWLPYPYVQLGNMNNTTNALDKKSFYDMHISEYERAAKAAKGLYAF